MRTRSPRITRRRALAGMALGAVALAARELLQPAALHGGPLAQTGAWIGGDAADRIGALYLERFPEERSVARLTRLLFGGTAPAAEARAHLVEAVVADFREGRTFMIDGWLMSRTEGRLCAALAVVSGAA